MSRIETREDGSLKPPRAEHKIRYAVKRLKEIDPDMDRIDSQALIVVVQLLGNITKRQARRREES